ncbi:MAG: serine hydroxymethyltransferase [Archaeoglobales archaeon]|nr:MAG: serine hydroxymethyltransferase [Archaeoglobales archaeon]
MLERLMEITKKHHDLFKYSIPLIASENVTSYAVRRLYMTDFGHRYAEGWIGKRFYQGCSYMDELEALAVELTKRIFGCEHANVQPISGVTANLATFFALTNPGDCIVSLSVPHGGHISHDKFSAAGIRGLRVEHYPFDIENFNIDVDETRRIVRNLKPKIFVLGASLFLFPHPVEEIVEIAGEVGARVVYDASHVLGLMAGGEFQDPIEEGADVVTASTHKTFFGPQRAIIMCKDELAKVIDRGVFPGVVSNHHVHSLACYVMACIEMIEFGRDYARQTVKNARVLAEEMYNLGYKVLCPDLDFTRSHQVAVDVSDIGGGDYVARKLEECGIILNKNLLPWDDVRNVENPSGIRIGVQEVTRLGMGEDEMREIARFIDMALKDKNPGKVREEVREFKSNFLTVKYTFEECPAYEVI